MRFKRVNPVKVKVQGKAADPYTHPEQTGELQQTYIENYDVLRVFGDTWEFEKELQKLEKETMKVGKMENELKFQREMILEITRELELIKRAEKRE